jgi:hypothetical protein
MKIIDKTPLVNEKGELGILQRFQGMFKYGFNWPTELETQKVIVRFFERQLEKGYTLIRNVTLGASGITVPIVLLGPPGIYAINITSLRGRFQAQGTSWNEESGNGYRPAKVNLIQETSRMAAAVKAFIERQGVRVPVNVEPVLIAAEPGMHIESSKPAVRIVLIDGVRSFVSGLSTSAPILSTEAIHEFTERIINPRPRRKATAPPAEIPRPASEEEYAPPPTTSRAQAIFDASEEAKPFNPADFNFEMVDDEPAAEAPVPAVQETDTPKRAVQRRRVLGMTPVQLVIVGALLLAFLCVLGVFAYLILNPSLLLP